MKKVVALIVILAIVVAGGCLYYFDLFNNVQFFTNIYAQLTSFGETLKTTLSSLTFLERFDGKLIFIFFYAACALVFTIIYLIICAICSAHRRKKKRKQQRANMSSNPDSLAFPVAFLKEPNSQFTIPQSVPASYTYKATEAIMSEDEKDIEFDWKNFIGGRRIVRKVIVGILIVVFLVFLVARFFWVMRNDAGSCGIAFIDNILNVAIITSVMGAIDGFFNGLFVSFRPDAADANKNVLLKNIFNGQNIYMSNLLNLISFIVIFIVLIVVYLLITRGLCRLFRKGPAKRRAKNARRDYDEDVANHKTPSFKPKHIRSTYIFNYFMAPVGYNTIPTHPTAPGQPNSNTVPTFTGRDEVGNFEPGQYENIASDTSKAELIMGGSILTGGNISSIAIIEPLSEQYSTEENLKRIDYYEDIGEGVKDVKETKANEVIDEEQPYEEYEDLAGTTDDVKVSTIADIDEIIEEDITGEDIDIDSARLGSIFEVSEELQEDGEIEVSESIAFDEDGFAYRKERLVEEEEFDEIPEPIDNDISYDTSTLVEDHTSIATIHEPDFELLDKVKLIKPIINITAQKQVDEVIAESNVEDTISSIASEDSYKEAVTTEEGLNDDQRDILAKYTPTLTPVEEFPDESLFVDDGSIKHAEDEVVEEVPEEKVLPEGIKPLHEIKNRETPKIVPLQIRKDEPVAEVEAKPAITPLAGPLHAINAASRKKDIKPVEINKDYRFALKRFQTTTYKGNLTPEEAFNLGVTKVTPVVNPVTNDVAKDSSIPSWMKRVKERNAKQQGVTESKLKQAEELSSIWEINSKKDVVEKVNEVSLRRRKKVEPIEPVVEEKEEQDEIKIARPIAPIAVQAPVEEKVEEKKEEAPKVVKPIAPLHRPTQGKKDIRPIKPITPIKPKK